MWVRILNPRTCSLQLKTSLLTKLSLFFLFVGTPSVNDTSRQGDLCSECQRKWDQVERRAPLKLLVSFKLTKAAANNSTINLKGQKIDGDKEQKLA